MKKILWVLGVIFYSGTAPAENLLSNCKFNESGDPLYYQVISDDNYGISHTVYWLKQSEPGSYTNKVGDHIETITPVYNHGKLDKEKTSQSILACISKGKDFQLPTFQEYQALRNCFTSDKTYTRAISGEEKQALANKFPDMV